MQPAPTSTSFRFAVTSKIYRESLMTLRRQALGQKIPALFVEDCPVSQEHCMRALTVEVAKDDSTVAGLIGNLTETAAGVPRGRALPSLSRRRLCARHALADQSHERQG